MAATAGVVTIYPYSFEAEIERFGVGKTRKVWYQVLFLPDALRAELPLDKFPRLRIEGEIADVPVSNALIPSGDGRNYVIVGPEVRASADVRLGDWVEMRFRIADQTAVDVPDYLARVLETDSDINTSWGELSPGKKRAIIQHIKTAKTETTRQRRLNEALEVMVDFKGDFRKWRDARKTGLS